MRIASTRSVTSVAAAVGAALVLSACGSSADEGSSSAGSDSGAPDTLVLAAIPSEESTSLQQRFSLIQQVIED